MPFEICCSKELKLKELILIKIKIKILPQRAHTQKQKKKKKQTEIICFYLMKIEASDRIGIRPAKQFASQR